MIIVQNVLKLTIALVEIIVFTILATQKNDIRVAFLRNIIAYGLSIVLLLTCFSFIYCFADDNFAPYVPIIFDFVIITFMPLIIHSFFSLSWRAVFFSLTIAVLGRYMSLVPTNMFIDALSLTGEALNGFIPLVIEIFFAFTAFALVYFIFTKSYAGRQEQYANKYSFLFLVILVLINVLELTLQQFLTYTNYAYLFLLSLTQFFYILMMLFIFYSLVRQGQNDVELMVVKQLWNEDKKHYEMQKESIDIINIKCHDLRHQIQDYRQQGNLTDKMMHQLEESIHIYDSVVKTGNEALDVILSSFSLRCQNNQVELTTMADGRGLDFVDEIDMYSLFTNMLDNALEYEETIPEESRFISLTIKAFNEMVHIHSENSYLGDKRGKQDELSTSKKDNINHGFGIKSMKNIVSKYNGQFDVLIADDMFQVDILLPKKEVKHE